METLSRLKEINEPLLAEKWEALFNNLGHVNRKLLKYDKALEYHQQVRIQRIGYLLRVFQELNTSVKKSKTFFF